MHFLMVCLSPYSSSGASVVAIDNKIEQAMVRILIYLLILMMVKTNILSLSLRTIIAYRA